MNERGQGLVEYALILVLVAVVVIVILVVLGPTTRNVFCQVGSYLGADLPGDTCAVVVITSAHYTPSDRTVHLRATYNGGVDPDVTLTASPGGLMQRTGKVYQIVFSLTGCPCTIVVTSSTGASAQTTVGP